MNVERQHSPKGGIPVKFFSVTPEEYDRIRKELEQGLDGSEEAEQRRRDLEGGIFFVEERSET